MYQLIDDYMEQRKFSRAATAAFTGHRFVDASLREHVKKRLTRAVLDAYGNGIRNFGHVDKKYGDFELEIAEWTKSMVKHSPAPMGAGECALFNSAF